MPGINECCTFDHVKLVYIQEQTLTVTTIKQQAKKVLELIERYAQNTPEVGVLTLK